jgi:A/G-specific adenine glycosylase
LREKRPSIPHLDERISQSLLAWYDRHARHLPWRQQQGKRPDPYRIWLSEIMLQQTTVSTVIAYFKKFIVLWPRIDDLAKASLEEVLTAWAGLGYYARARNLHKTALLIAEQGAWFPDNEQALRLLPGIGDYTAAAISAIAFGKKALVMDGNIERITARFFVCDKPLPAAKSSLKAHLQSIMPASHFGDFAQAMMDLGAMICTPKNPKCSLCPWQSHCQAYQSDSVLNFPVKIPKKKNKSRYGTVFWLENHSGDLWVRRRPEKGLLGGMIEIPTSKWEDDSETCADLSALPEDFAKIDWQKIPGLINHHFTHFDLNLTIKKARINIKEFEQGFWCPRNDLQKQAFPTLMQKVIRHVYDLDKENR